jgi:hypothetical protein
MRYTPKNTILLQLTYRHIIIVKMKNSKSAQLHTLFSTIWVLYLWKTIWIISCHGYRTLICLVFLMDVVMRMLPKLVCERLERSGFY